MTTRKGADRVDGAPSMAGRRASGASSKRDLTFSEGDFTKHLDAAILGLIVGRRSACEKSGAVLMGAKQHVASRFGESKFAFLPQAGQCSRLRNF